MLKRPGAPVIRAGSSGTRAASARAIARWSAPTHHGGTPVTKYRVRAQRRNSANRVVATTYSGYLSPTARSATMRLAHGRYTFAVMTWNKVGSSAVVADLERSPGPLTCSGQDPASRASALRTTAGSSVCHIGGRLARRKVP